jgi:hypothetical protein
LGLLLDLLVDVSAFLEAPFLDDDDAFLLLLFLEDDPLFFLVTFFLAGVFFFFAVSYCSSKSLSYSESLRCLGIPT